MALYKLTGKDGQADGHMEVKGCISIQKSNEPSPGYAGVSLSLAKTELNARGLHRTDGLRFNPIILFTFLLVGLK